MKHPLAGKTIYYYLAVWTVIIALHATVLYSFYAFPPVVCVADAVIFNILIAGLGLSYWYVVQYISTGQSREIIVSHIAGVAISVFLVVYIANFVLSSVFSADTIYQEFLSGSLLWRIIIAAFSLALIIMIYYLLRYTNNLKQKAQDELQLQHMLRYSELEMLKFQINPHFLFNSLNSISSLTITNPAKANDMVIKLSEFLRASLGKSGVRKHPLKEEFEQMNLYLEIEKIRFGERLNSTVKIDTGCEKMTLPSMILQPLYENAIKYGIYERLGQVEIKTICSSEDQKLKISISNSYDSEGVSQKGKGIGLKNVRSMLELIYGIPDLITIEKNRTDFTVHLLIPQLQNNDQSVNY